MYFTSAEGWFIQPTANIVLFEAIFHLHMLLLIHIIQREFPILINGTNLFLIYELLVGIFFHFSRTVYKQTVKHLISRISKGTGGGVDTRDDLKVLILV